MQLRLVTCSFVWPYSVSFCNCSIHGGWTFPLGSDNIAARLQMFLYVAFDERP